MVGIYILGRLVYLNVTGIPTKILGNSTYGKKDGEASEYCFRRWVWL
jgi:hypothetical protein